MSVVRIPIPIAVTALIRSLTAEKVVVVTVINTIWHGDPTESLALVDASNRNCGCKYGLMGVRTSTCGVHDAMVRDQRFLDGLLFMRRYAERLLAEEFAP